MINELRVLKGLNYLLLIAIWLSMFGVIEITEAVCGAPGYALNCPFSNNSIQKNEYQVGESVQYYCQDTPCILSTQMRRHCLENGSWSGTIPFCHKSSGLENIKQLSLIQDDKRVDANTSMDKKNSSCIFSKFGSNTIWEAVLIKSFRIFEVTFIFQDRIKDNTFVVVMDGNITRSCEKYAKNLDQKSLHFTCKNGLLGDKIRISQNGESPGVNERFEVCEVYLFIQRNYACLRPDFPYKSTGRKISSNPTKYRFECFEGYELEGNEEVFCQEDGSWAPRSPICKKKTHCKELPEVANGVLKYNSSANNSTAWLECNDGYRPLSDNLIHCLPTGTWTSLSLRCELIECDPNPTIPHGKGILPSGLAYGSKLHITCDKGYVATESEPRECHLNGTWGNLNICSQIACSAISTEVVDGGQWVSLNETISIRVLICQTGYHIEGSPAVTQCLPNGSWSYTTAVCKKTPPVNIWNGEWTPSTVLLSAVAVGAGTAVCILCLAMCCWVIRKRRQSKTNTTVFHVGLTDSILYHEGSKEQHYQKTNTYEDVIELRHTLSSKKPRKPSSALPHLPIPTIDTDPVYAQPFETSTVFPKLTPPNTSGDLYTAHIYAEPVDSHRSPSMHSAFNSATETWLRSGTKTFGRKMNLPGRASLPEDSALQTNRNSNGSNKPVCNSTNMGSINIIRDEKRKNTQYESEMQTTISELISNSIYLNAKGKSFDSGNDLEQLQMIDNDIYQDDYFSNV